MRSSSAAVKNKSDKISGNTPTNFTQKQVIERKNNTVSYLILMPLLGRFCLL